MARPLFGCGRIGYLQLFGVSVGYIVERDVLVVARLIQIHRAEVRPADARGILQHLLEHRFQFARRGADDLKNLRGRRLLLQRLREVARSRLHLVEQPDILDRDHGLIGEAARRRATGS